MESLPLKETRINFKNDEIRDQIKTWCEALRSGNYNQGRGSLNPSTGYFCCLGVACKELIPKNYLRCNLDIRMSGASAYCQPKSPEWLKLINSDIRNFIGNSLTRINDDDQANFNEIADLIESIYLLDVLNLKYTGGY